MPMMPHMPPEASPGQGELQGDRAQLPVVYFAAMGMFSKKTPMEK